LHYQCKHNPQRRESGSYATDVMSLTVGESKSAETKS
jgi:hypothetical protein